jgi:sugar phosphate isomerase/epimerase
MWTSYFMNLTPERMVETFAERGWHELELSDEHGKNLLDRGAPAVVGADFRRFAQDLGVTFPQGHLWLVCDIAASNQDAVIDTLRGWLDLFLAVGVQAAVLHPGGGEMLERGCDPEALLAARVRALTQLADHVKGSAMTICLENIPSAAPLAEDLCAIVEASGSPHVGICLDTGHLHLASGDQADFIRQAAPHLKALHIADNDGSSDQHLLPYGRGTIAWDTVAPTLREIGYAGLFNLEIPGERHCPMPVLLAKLDYAKRLLALMLDGVAPCP